MPLLIRRNQNNDIDRKTVRHFLLVSRQYGRDFYLSWLPLVSAVCLNTLVPFFLGKVLAALAHPGTPLQGIIFGFVIAGLAGILINRVAFVSMLRLQASVMAKLQHEAVTALAYRGTSFHNDHVGGKLVSDATDYPQAYLRLSDTVIVSILPFVAVLLTGVSILLFTAPVIGLIVLAMAVLAIASAIKFRVSMAAYRYQRIDATKAATAHTADVITNIQTVKAFGQEKYELANATKLFGELETYRKRDWNRLAINGNNRIIGLFLFEIVFLAAIVYQITRYPELLAAGIFALTYTVTLTNRMFEIGNMLRNIEEALLLAEPMTTILGQKREIQDKHDATDLVVSSGSIMFNNIQFVYTDNPQADTIFEGLNVSIKPGERIGLVGPSGGGKSTLTKLLLRFEDLTAGSITIDDQDIANVSQQSLRQSIAYVPQEPLLFHRSIRDNIGYADPMATDEAICSAAKRAYADEFIAQLPNGYDTIVGERGVKLSGGQRQRIAIARAILKDAPILVLDEATSALDSESELLIQRALWKLMEGRTTIVIAHRLSTIQKMDRILVLDDGAVVEQGSHKKLLAQNGIYYRLWSHQSGGFIEE